MFHRADRRWTDGDVATIASWLRPAMGVSGGLLDIGGGTGGLSVRLAAALQAGVTVLDPTPEMVAYIPADSAVSVVLGVAEKMPLPDGSFDAALVSDALHHFRDRRAAIGEIARVVRPGGVVAVLELDPSGFDTRAMGLIERLVGEPAAFLTPDALVELMADAGIQGTATAERGSSYRFLGTVD